MSFPSFALLTGLAAQESGALRALEFDFPASAWEWVVYGGGFFLVFVLAIFVYFRDTASFSGIWKVWLTTLRVAVLAALVVIAINPQERTQKMLFRPSRVAVLVDTSLSMDFPERLPSADASPSGTPATADTEIPSRAEAVEALLTASPLLEKLREEHEISFYTFDSELSSRHEVLQPIGPASADVAGSSDGSGGNPGESDEAGRTTSTDWEEVLRPRGLETRLGESLIKLMEEAGGRTLSGIVVVSDGGLNAGVDHTTANAAAREGRVRLISVGVGSTEKQAHLRIAGLQAPTDVHIGDPYEISAFVQGQGLAGRTVTVELLTRPDGEDESQATVVETRDVNLLEDGVPVEVTFPREPSVEGKFNYLVRAHPPAGVLEAETGDNQDEVVVNVVDRKTRVLLIAGGPTRDYHFVRNMLYRHSAVEVDVWLQSVLSASAGAVSQDADNLLLRFPDSAADLFEYDVIIAFDPDWNRIPGEQLERINEWVDQHSGGLILVAGDVHTPELAGGTEDLGPIQELYPVFLHSYFLDFHLDNEADQPWPPDMTREGTDAGFLQLTEDPATSAALWNEFSGVYRSYPTAGARSGATVYAHFSDPRAQTEHGQPVLLASQFYGSGRTFYVGSGEMWRLRAVSDEYYDRFWTKLIREVGQGRMQRGAKRARLTAERDRYYLGQTVRVQARVLDPQFQPLDAEAVTLEVYDPSGKPLVPARKLVRDRNRPGEYVGDFRASLPGRYRLELPVPESGEQEVREISVRLPDLESDYPEQNAGLLTELVRDTGGQYLRLDEAEEALPALLPNMGEEFLVDERLRTLWDRQWVLFLLVGLLSTEWLTRKLLKLA